MTIVELHPPAPHGAVARAVLGRLAWGLLLLPPVVFAWRESHFQYDAYLPGQSGPIVGSAMFLLATMAVVMVASIAWFRPYPTALVVMFASFAALTIFHAVLNQLLTGDGKLFVALEAVFFALLMLPIISDKGLLRRFLKVNFLLGVTLIALNMVTVLHWLGVVSLPYQQVPRIGSEAGLFDLDPLHFGLFGLTENLNYPSHPFEMPRLQGFSLEPIHWAYFVFLTLASGIFLLSMEKGRHTRLVPWLLFALIVVHIFFVYSSVAFLAFIAWCIVLVFFGLLRRYRAENRREAMWGLVTVVLTPGLLVPFVMVRLPQVAVYLVAEDVMNKGSNWESKIGFLSMGSALYTRFLPAFGEIPAAGHNLLLSTYLQFGYFLTIPLLVFLLLFFRRTFEGTPFPVLAGSAVTVIAHSMVVPPQLFYPAGAMWIMMAVGVAYHFRTLPAPPAVAQRDSIPAATTPLRGAW